MAAKKSDTKIKSGTAKGKPELIKKKPVEKNVTEIEHELRVHKIELQLQNEALLDTQTKLEKLVEEFSALFSEAIKPIIAPKVCLSMTLL